MIAARQDLYQTRPACRRRAAHTASATLVIAASAWWFLALGPSLAAEDHCDHRLRTQPTGEHPYGYRIRGDRCEGVYVKELSSTTLLVASWTTSFEDYELSSGEELLIDWRSPGDDPVRLRAHGLRRQLYYRMDSTRPPGDRSYTWPADVLAALRVPAQELGVVGWTTYDVGDVERIVHLPLAVSQGETAGPSDRYEMILVPGRELIDVFVSLTKLGTDPTADVVLKDGEALGYGYYPAGRRIAITISNLEGRGIYYLEIGALLRGGGAANLDFWFFHPGKP